MMPSLIDLAKSQDMTAFPAWLKQNKEKAMARLESEGLPTAKTESWQNTPLKKLLKTEFVKSSSTADDDIAWAKSQLPALDSDAYRLYVVAGIIHGEVPNSGVEILEFEEKHQQTWYDSDTPFSTLNELLFDKSYVINLKDSFASSKRLEIIHVDRSSKNANVSCAKIQVNVAPRANAAVLQAFLGSSDSSQLCNGTHEFIVGENATLRLSEVMNQEDNSSSILHTRIKQKAGSTLESLFVFLSGSLNRQDIHVDLDGDGTHTKVDGVYVTKQKDHADCHIKVNHLSSNGTSHVNFRGVLTGSSKAVFDAIAVVAKGTKNNAAHQNNRNILLSKDSTVFTKPHLEIDSDDVSCSHGATIGTLDQNQLFYLQSRGVAKDDAKTLLTQSFLKENLESVVHKPWLDWLGDKAQAQSGLSSDMDWSGT